MIRLKPAQAVLEVGLGILGRASAALGHEEDLVAPAPLRDRLAHPILGLAVHVVPGIVEERDSLVDGPLDQADRILLLLRHGGVEPAQAHHGDLLAGAAQRSKRDAAGTLVLSRLGRGSQRGRGQTGCAGLQERLVDSHSRLARSWLLTPTMRERLWQSSMNTYRTRAGCRKHPGSGKFVPGHRLRLERVR